MDPRDPIDPISPGTRVSGTDESPESGTPSLASSSSSGKSRRAAGDEPSHEKLKKAVPGGCDNIGGGLLQGAGSVLAGFAGGAAALVAAPVMGARDAGPKGAAVGLAAGVVAFVALPVAGVVSGIGEVVAGAANTPSASIFRSVLYFLWSCLRLGTQPGHFHCVVKKK